MLKDSFRTTNCIENVNGLLEQLTHNVRRWSNSSQRHRWVATALLDIEPRLRRVKGYRHLPALRHAPCRPNSVSHSSRKRADPFSRACALFQLKWDLPPSDRSRCTSPRSSSVV